MRRFSLLAPELDHSSERDGYRWHGARVGRAVGAEQIGAGLYELGEGERTYPYHLHQVTGPGTVLILAENRAPESIEYPDSGKVSVHPPGKVFRTADSVDYWDGE